ncbi:MAG: phosphomethylpyrimidine synthase [Archaeoglobaceae archaeon]|nr:phosphomethylpyrimidine synthase [Archaeoglobaceae archaeon]MDW8013511.1 phosphomethylpyrimidine synthase [Archaeoglobaceae archaeon]
MLIEEARKGYANDLVKKAAEFENISLEKFLRLISHGYVVMPKNVLRDTAPKAIGMMCSTKVNVNVGTSIDHVNLDEEVEKVRVAEKFGADAVMDLSTGGDLDAIRRRLIKETRLPFGTVPIYQAARGCRIVDMSEDDFFEVVEKQCRDGVDFMTIHAGVNWESVEKLKRAKRLVGIVSRGGAITLAWMLHNEKENPYYKEFDYLLEILKQYDVTISLGDAYRPGSIFDADRVKLMEYVVLGELVERCRERGVQCIVEGPGHVSIDLIEPSVKAMKIATNNAPLYLLGPLVTDVALGYDHIAAAIGAAIAAKAGADFICYVTPSEHLGLPTVEDVKEGVIAAKIAAHAADLIKNEKAKEWDYEMSIARKKLDWEKQFKLSLDPEKAREIWSRRRSNYACSMCGDLCAIKIAEKFFEISL